MNWLFLQKRLLVLVVLCVFVALYTLHSVREGASHDKEDARQTLRGDVRSVEISAHERLAIREGRNWDLNAVLHHTRDVVRETTRVLNLEVGRDSHEQTNDAR